jgi:toxin-antitoxin system PIN domain toxin
LSAALLDVNVLLAIFDGFHANHDLAARWFLDNPDGWATCALTENGFARVRANPSYPAPAPVARSLADLRGAYAAGGHEFWPCEVSLTDAGIDPSRILCPGAVTDTYLVALAARHGGRLVTFDRRIGTAPVAGAHPEHLVVLGN